MYSFRGEGGPSWRTYLAFPSMETVGPRFPFELEDGTDPGNYYSFCNLVTVYFA